MDVLQQHLEHLSESHEIAFHPAPMPGWKAFVIIRRHPLPGGYSLDTSDVLVKIPANYPAGSPDMFWTPVDLKLASGAIPANAEVVETLLGDTWRRFSWHPKPGSWNPGKSDLNTYLGFVDSRLELGR